MFFTPPEGPGADHAVREDMTVPQKAAMRRRQRRRHSLSWDSLLVDWMTICVGDGLGAAWLTVNRYYKLMIPQTIAIVRVGEMG